MSTLQPEETSPAAHSRDGRPSAYGPLPDGFDLSGQLAPVQWVKAPNGTGHWVITSYKLGRRILADPRFRRDLASGPAAPTIAISTPAAQAIISLDGPDHRRVRGLVARAFTERRIADLEPFVSEHVGELLDGLEAAGSPADFIAQVAAPLPFDVLCHLLGVPMSDRKIFNSWVDVLFRLNGDLADGRKDNVSLARYMMRLVAAKREQPGADLISDLIAAAGKKRGITNRELVTLCLSLLMAGYASTVDQIALSVLTILLDRSLMRSLIRSPELIPQAVEELVRLNPAAYMTFPRLTTEPVSVGGVTIQPGELVVVSILGSNRDTAVGLPGEVTLDRQMPSHLTFGHGVHRCLGAPLARLELTTLLAAMVKRRPDLRLADGAAALAWKSEMGTRGPSDLRVAW